MNDLILNDVIFPEATYTLGGGDLADHIDWFRIEEFRETWRWENEGTFTVWGHKSPLPLPGETIVSEHEASFILFEIVDVDLPGDPPDFFFAKVKPVKQYLKATGEVLFP